MCTVVHQARLIEYVGTARLAAFSPGVRLHHDLTRSNHLVESSSSFVQDDYPGVWPIGHCL